MKETEKYVLRALLANCKISDQAIARNSVISQPTVTRVRRRFERERIVESYIALPNLAKLGFEIVSFLSLPDYKAKEIKENKNIVFATMIFTPSGDAKLLAIGVHRNYGDLMRIVTACEGRILFSLDTAAPPLKNLTFKDIPF